MRLRELRVLSFSADGTIEALDYAVSLTERGGVYVGCIECLQDGRRVILRDGRETFITGSLERGLDWFRQAAGVRA